eukprot:s635_g15.t1
MAAMAAGAFPAPTLTIFDALQAPHSEKAAGERSEAVRRKQMSDQEHFIISFVMGGEGHFAETFPEESVRCEACLGICDHLGRLGSVVLVFGLLVFIVDNRVRYDRCEKELSEVKAQLAQKENGAIQSQPQVDGVGANNEVMVKPGEGHETGKVVIHGRNWEIDFKKSSQMIGLVSGSVSVCWCRMMSAPRKPLSLACLLVFVIICYYEKKHRNPERRLREANAHLQNQLEQKENENASLIKAQKKLAQKENEKALLVRNLQKQLARSEKEYAQKAYEHARLERNFAEQLAQKENEKALLVRDLQDQLEQKENENASLIKAKEEIAQKKNEKALSVTVLQNQLARTEKECASLVRDFEKQLAQKENEKALLVRNLQDQLEQKENGNASLIKAKEEMAQKENEKALLVRDLQDQFEQKENGNASLIKAEEEMAQKENEKALLVRDLQNQLRDLQNQLEQKENENASLIKAKEEMAQKEYEKALLVSDLQKQLARTEKECAQKANEHALWVRDLQKQLSLTEKEFVKKADEHASLVRDFEKQLAQKENELAQRIQSQPQVDGETWQFQGDSSEWVSFPDCANKALMVKFGEGHETCEIVIDGRNYKIDFKKSSQMNVRTKKERQIRCFFDLPSHWQMTDEDALKFLKDSLCTQRSPGLVQLMLPVVDQDVKSRLTDLLNRSLSRHDGSQCNCLHGRSNFVVTEASQVNNLHLWRRYQRFVRSMQDRHKQHGISPRRSIHQSAKT